MTVDHASVKAVLIDRQIRGSQHYNKSHRVKTQRALVLRERCWGTGNNNIWMDVTLQGLMRRIDATRWCLKTLAEPSDGPGLISGHMALTFLTFQSDTCSRIQTRSLQKEQFQEKTQSFQEKKGKFGQIKQVTQSNQDHHID